MVSIDRVHDPLICCSHVARVVFVWQALIRFWGMTTTANMSYTNIQKSKVIQKGVLWCGCSKTEWCERRHFTFSASLRKFIAELTLRKTVSGPLLRTMPCFIKENSLEKNAACLRCCSKDLGLDVLQRKKMDPTKEETQSSKVNVLDVMFCFSILYMFEHQLTTLGYFNKWEWVKTVVVNLPTWSIKVSFRKCMNQLTWDYS